MAFNANCIFLCLVFVVLIAGGKPQANEMLNFQQAFTNILFPKEPGIVKVRKVEDIKKVNGVAVLDFIGLVERYGYPAEEHYVTTEDGYNLVIHRIPGSPVSNNMIKKKVVFIQHGFVLSSDSWVLFGPGKDLVFSLADEGYDVWLGNMRGNTYCRSHVSLTTYDKKFWEYSYHEVGTQDLPAMIDYVLKHTGQESLRYIGFSMGTSSLFVLLSARPEYNAKIKLGICLAPVAYWTETKSQFKQIFSIMPQVMPIMDRLKLYDVAPQSAMSVSMGRSLCNDYAITQPLCIAMLFMLAGSDPVQLNTTALPFIFEHFPAGSSMQTFYNYYQNYATNQFQSYDYGPIGNYERYKQKTPIIYNMNKISAPIALFYGANDDVVRIPSVLQLSRRLPNVVLMQEVPFTLFTHIDFLWAIDVKELLYDHVIKFMQESEEATSPQCSQC